MANNNDPLFGGLPYQNIGPHLLHIDIQVLVFFRLKIYIS